MIYKSPCTFLRIFFSSELNNAEYLLKDVHSYNLLKIVCSYFPLNIFELNVSCKGQIFLYYRSDTLTVSRRYMAEILPIRRKTLSN